MIIRKLCTILLGIAACLIFTGANQHLQTTINQNTGYFQIHIKDKRLKINLHSSNITIEKYPNGCLKHLSFIKANTQYKIYFHPKRWRGKEQLSLYQEFRDLNGKMLLHGTTASYDEENHQLSEAQWFEGKLHGKQKTWNGSQQLIENKAYSHGYPINTWALYYPNGNKARTITFPKTEQEWKKHRIRAKPCLCEKRGNAIFQLSTKKNSPNRNVVQRKWSKAKRDPIPRIQNGQSVHRRKYQTLKILQPPRKSDSRNEPHRKLR